MADELIERARSTASEQRIVVGVDRSESSMRALDWAARQADRTGALLEIHTAYEPGYSFITREEVERSMQRLVADATARVAELTPMVTTKTATHDQSPANALIEASRGADLLVLGTRGLGGFKGLLLGSVTDKCSHHAECPITIVR